MRWRGRLHTWAEGILDPLDGNAVVCVAIDTDNIEAGCVLAEAFVHCQKHRGGGCEFALLTMIHAEHGPNEAARGSVPNFDENERLSVKHDEVDFAAAAAKIALHRTQSMATKKRECRLLGVAAP